MPTGDQENDELEGTLLPMHGYNPDPIASVPALRTLGTGANQAAAGNHTHGGGVAFASASSSASDSNSTAAWANTSLSLTATTAGAGQKALIIVDCHVDCTSATPGDQDNIELGITIDGGADATSLKMTLATSNPPHPVSLSKLFTGVSNASHTWRLRFKCTTGSIVTVRVRGDWNAARMNLIEG